MTRTETYQQSQHPKGTTTMKRVLAHPIGNLAAAAVLTAALLTAIIFYLPRLWRALRFTDSQNILAEKQL